MYFSMLLFTDTVMYFSHDINNTTTINTYKLSYFKYKIIHIIVVATLNNIAPNFFSIFSVNGVFEF